MQIEPYKLFDLENLLQSNRDELQDKRCRIIGSVTLVNNHYILQNINSLYGGEKVKVKVVFNNKTKFICPPNIPQSVQIFGKMIFIGESIEPVIQDDSLIFEDIFVKVDVIQNLPSKLFFKMHETLIKVKQ